MPAGEKMQLIGRKVQDDGNGVVFLRRKLYKGISKAENGGAH